MYSQLIYILQVCIVVLCGISCQTVSRHNSRLVQPISPDLLRLDAQLIKQKLDQNHPLLYQYISKSQLQKLFDSIVGGIDSPMTPLQFYFTMSPYVASIKQAHTQLLMPQIRYSNREIKAIERQISKTAFAHCKPKFIDGKLLTTNYLKNDSTVPPATQILAVNGQRIDSLYSLWLPLFSTDGYIESSRNAKFNIFLSQYFYYSKKFIDSLNITFLLNDQVLTKVVSPEYRSAKKPTTNTNSIVSLPYGLSQKALKRIMGFRRGEYTRRFDVDSVDSTIGVLRIKGFVGGKYRKAYRLIFDSISRSGIRTLAIDLRGNTGGRLNEINHLAAYLYDSSFKMHLNPVLIDRLAFDRIYFHSIPKWLMPLSIVAFPFYKLYTAAKISQNESGEIIYKLPATHRPIEPLRPFYNKKLYVMTNELSYSASSILSNYLQQTSRAKVIGQETGGAAYSTVAGVSQQYILPHSHLKFVLWTMDLRSSLSFRQFGRGVVPDIPIQYQIKDYINSSDLELEYIRNENNKQAQKL